jgi:hypothetical protein
VAILFLRNPRVSFYFFLVVFGAFVAVFFVVPHAAPLDLQAIRTLLHKRYFKIAQCGAAVNNDYKMITMHSGRFSCRPLCNKYIMDYLPAIGGILDDMQHMQKRDHHREIFFQDFRLSLMRRRPSYLFEL